MNRFVITIACAFVALPLATPPILAADKPNVLFIAADDMNCDLSAFGNSQVKTPHLERLCKMGVRFDRAYCQQPLCGPSRASIMTGLRPDTLDMHTLKHELRDKNPNVVTMGQMFRNNGYFSARAGKIYHYGNPGQIGTDANDDPATWDERFNPQGIDSTQEDKITRYGFGRQDKGLGISMAWWDPVSRDEEHTDGMVASKIIELMKQKKDEPFFLAAGFFNPHCPYVAPKRYFDMYPLDEITIPDLEEAKKDLEDVPPMAVMRDTKNWPYYFKDVTVEEARKCKQAYYASISFVDAQVGRLLDALDENGLMDNTIIVFWSDHGYFLGEKGLWYKRKAFERSAKMPMVIAAPGLTKNAATSKPVELLDLYPTLADLCGIKPPQNLEGASLRPLLTDPAQAKWNKPAVTQIWHNKKAWGYSMRTDRYRYTEWLEGKAGRELYDHANDPDEITNLVDKSQHKSTVASLSAQLKKYVQLKPHKREAVATSFQKPNNGDGFRSIFDGKTLTGWKCVDMSYWSVQDEAITGESTSDNPCKSNKFVVWQGGDVADFEIKLKFRVSGNGCNSGVQFRSEFKPNGLAVGYQADIYQAGPYLGGVCDELHKRSGKELLTANGTKTVIDVDGKRVATNLGRTAKMKPADWNDYHITAKGQHITLRINGVTCSELVDREKDHSDLKGQLGLQLRAGKPMKVQFKDIQLKQL